MPIPTLDLGECRTGYSDDIFSHTLEWGSDNTDPLLIETVEESTIISNGDSDSGTRLVDNGDYSYTYLGNYTVESFPNVDMTFRDFSTNEDITISGWPPSDERAKDMHEFNLDPLDAKTYEITISWKISAELNGVPQTSSPYEYDEDLEKYVRTDTFTFYKDAVNRTGEQFGISLTEYFNSTFDYESSAIQKELNNFKSIFPASTVTSTSSTPVSITRGDHASSGSAWGTQYSEDYVADTLISSQDWDLRVGKGGQIYSLITDDLGETVPPQKTNNDVAPWVDEVWQTVAVDQTTTPTSYNHSAGVYLANPILNEPYYTPRLATQIDEDDKSFYSINWCQPSNDGGSYQLDRKSYVLNLTKYKDLGDGVIEVTLGHYNFGPDTYDWHNMPWGGVRRTSMEHGFYTQSDQQTYDPLTGFFPEPIRKTEDTGGWFVFSSDENGDGHSMGWVYGLDGALPDSYSSAQNFIRMGYTQPLPLDPNVGETDFRNYLVATCVRRYNLSTRRGIWVRCYFVFGDDRDQVRQKILNRDLVNQTTFEEMSISENDVDLIGYQIINDNGKFTIDKSTTPDFYLYSGPIDDSMPIFEIVNRDNSRFISWNPYTAGITKFYDGNVKYVNLLGFTLRTTVNEDSLDNIFSGVFEHHYKADGELLSGVIS